MHAVPVEHAEKPAKPVDISTLPVRPGEDPWTKEELDEVKAALTEDIARFESQIEISTAELVGLLGTAARAPAGIRPTSARPTSSATPRCRWPTTPGRCWTSRGWRCGHIELGTYGSCDNCGQPIGKGRLQAFPRPRCA